MNDLNASEHGSNIERRDEFRRRVLRRATLVSSNKITSIDVVLKNLSAKGAYAVSNASGMIAESGFLQIPGVPSLSTYQLVRREVGAVAIQINPA